MRFVSEHDVDFAAWREAVDRQAEDRGLSRSEVARRAGMSPQALGYYWTDGAKPPAPMLVFRIEDAIGITRGSTSHLLGFLPVEVRVRDALEGFLRDDGRLDRSGVAAMLALFDSLVGGNAS